MNGAMDTVVFSAVFMIVILACFVLAIVAVVKEEQRQIRAEGGRYSRQAAIVAKPVSQPAAPMVIADAPSAVVPPAHFLPAP
jgi:hypothetical protein